MSFTGTLVVLTEDSGSSGWAPVVACVRAICHELIPSVAWQRVRVLPREDTPSDALRSVGANHWKGTNGAAYNDRITLVRYIANQLLGGPEDVRVVFFHVDGDRPWSAGPVEQCENAQKFDRLVRSHVRQIVDGKLRPLGRHSQVDELMMRLHLLVPTVAIESWLYQNTAAASAACRGRTCAGAHVAHYNAWRDDRTLLDDITGLKGRRDLHCLDDKDKGVLAQHLPATEMRRAGRSFARAVERVGEDGALLHMLIATGTPPPT